MNCTIRRAEEEDLASLAELYLEFHNFHARGVPSRLRAVEAGNDGGALLEAIRKILADEKAALFVAEDGGQVTGFVEIYLKEAPEDPAVVQRRYAYVQSLMVTAAGRGQGLGGRLMEAAHRWAREQGATEVELYIWEFPEGPLGFYETLGYTTLKRRLKVDL